MHEARSARLIQGPATATRTGAPPTSDGLSITEPTTEPSERTLPSHGRHSGHSRGASDTTTRSSPDTWS